MASRFRFRTRGGGGASSGAPASPTVITQDGLVATFAAGYTTGQYADGSYWVVAPPVGVVLNSVAIAVGEVSNLYVGGVMVDPADMTKQGFDNRVNVFGPGTWYDVAVAQTLPLTVDHYGDGSPKTIWLYRGLDAVLANGGYSACYAMVEITVVASARSAAHIKPTGLFVATPGKPEYTTADINYTVFTPYTIPAAAVAAEPAWNTLANGFMVRPLVRWGPSFPTGIIPTLYQDAYPGNQATRISKLLLGAISTSTSRVDLINRIVRDGLMIHSHIALGGTPWIANGGFGTGGKFLRFFAGKFLNVAGMLTTPATVAHSGAATNVEYFHEDGAVFAGSTKALYGTLQSTVYPTPPYSANNDVRDAGGVREPHWVITITGTAQAGAASTITLAAGATGVANFDRIYIVSGPGATEFKWVTNWNNGTKVATVDSAWSVQPTSASVYEVYNAGGYQIIGSQRVSGATAAVILAGYGTAWGNDTWLQYIKRFVDTDTGLIGPRYPTMSSPTYWQDATADVRKFFDSSTWTTSFWTDAAAVYSPLLSSPSGTQTGATTANLAVTTNIANGTLYSVATLSGTPSAAQIIAGQNSSGAAAPYAANQSISTTGVKTFPATGLTASTTYYTYFMHESSAGNQSAVAAASSFTTASAGAWTTVWTIPAPPGGQFDNAGSVGYTFVLAIPFAQLSASGGTQIRLTLQGGASGENTEMSALYVGNGGGGDAYDFTGTPVRLQKTASNTIDVPVNTNTTVTDAASFVKDGSNPLVIAMSLTNSAKDNVKTYSTPGLSTGATYYKNSSGDAGTVDKTGYTAEAPNGGAWVTKVELFI